MKLRQIPLLADLPPPPPGRAGWPWTEFPSGPADLPPLPSPAPRITVITPSYNQGQYIEETIRSILLQGYPNLEYIIIDGGSSDQTLDVIKKYEPWITYWVSEKDNGQAHAINKGLARSTGELWNWINSDDLLTQGTLWCVAAAFQQGAHLVAGAVTDFGVEHGETTRLQRDISIKQFVTGKGEGFWHQPGTWLRRELVIASGGIDESYRYLFDLDLMLRYLERYLQIQYTEDALARFRLHPTSKTVSEQDGFFHERLKVLDNFAQTAQTVEHRNLARSRVNTIHWHLFLGTVIRNSEQSRLKKILKISAHLLLKPHKRIDRLTLGLLKGLLLGKTL